MKKLIFVLLMSVCAYGQTIKFPSVDGTPTVGNCVKWTGTAKLGDAGAACGSGGGGTTVHSSLTNLDYGLSGHTGFQAALAGEQLTALSNLSGVNTGDQDLSGYRTIVSADAAYEAKNANIQAHISSTSNPHSTTAAQVGLGNVDNTSDANKPVSTATATALAGKASSTASTTVNGTTCTLGSTCTVTASAGSQPFMVGNSYTGLPATGFEYYRAIIADTSGTAFGSAITITLPANCSGTKFNGNVNASTGATVLIKKNGSTICTGTVAAGGQNATFTGAGGAFTSGDVLSIVGGTADPTWANPVWAIAGSR